MLNKSSFTRWAVIVLIIFYAGGVAGQSLPFTKSLFILLTPFILLMSIGLLLFFHEKWNKQFVYTILFIVVSGYLIEAAGVNTDLIFGRYSYGETLGFKLFNTPLIIGFNWFLMIYCSYIIVQKIKIHWTFQLIIAALLTTLYDFVMEPVAIKTGMWKWSENMIPLQNYFAWFTISLAYLIILKLLKSDFKNRFVLFLFSMQIIFFILLNFTWNK